MTKSEFDADRALLTLGEKSDRWVRDCNACKCPVILPMMEQSPKLIIFDQ